MEPQEYSCDHVLFKEGDEPDYLYILYAGTLSVSAAGQVLKTLSVSGEVIGERALISNEQRSATVKVGPVEVSRGDNAAALCLPSTSTVRPQLQLFALNSVCLSN